MNLAGNVFNLESVWGSACSDYPIRMKLITIWTVSVRILILTIIEGTLLFTPPWSPLILHCSTTLCFAWIETCLCLSLALRLGFARVLSHSLKMQSLCSWVSCQGLATVLCLGRLPFPRVVFLLGLGFTVARHPFFMLVHHHHGRL